MKCGDILNIVFISAELPYPSNSGGRIYTWERLKQLKIRVLNCIGMIYCIKILLRMDYIQ